MIRHDLVMQVLQTLRSLIAGRGAEDSVGIYLPTARGYFDVDEKALKQAVKEVGGGWNTSSLFLPATSVATCVTSETGKTRKSVVKIPRSKVAPNLLKRLDSCKLIIVVKGIPIIMRFPALSAFSMYWKCSCNFGLTCTCVSGYTYSSC